VLSPTVVEAAANGEGVGDEGDHMPNWPLKGMRAAVQAWSSDVDRILRGEARLGQLLPFARA
jgi:hypothetical protein